MQTKSYRIQFYFLFFTLFICHISYGQITSKQVDKLVEEALTKFNVAGVSVGIVKDGKIIHLKGYGLKSIVTKEKVNIQTNFAIGSNSKAFTTAALVLLVEDGKITWQDKVVEHIPEFKMYNSYVTQNFNIQDLLTHRSGLGLGIGDLMMFPDGSDFTIEDILSSFQYFEPQSAFRTKFDYDNLLYMVAGELIKRKSGMTWEAFVKTRIMDKLAMDNSFPSFAMITNQIDLATPHTTTPARKLKALPNWDEMISGAAGGIYSNADDMCKWLLLHLNNGKYGKNLENRLFTEKSQGEMWKIHTTLESSKNPRYNSHFTGYGLGWFLKDVKGNMVVSHTGGLPGMLSKVLMIPDLNLGLVILTNTDPGGAALFSAVTNTIVDSYLGLDDFNWIDKNYQQLEEYYKQTDKVTKKVWKTVATTSDSHIDKEDYIGIYQDKWFGKVEVFNKGDKLWFKSYRSPKLNGSMSYYNANTFAIKWEYQDMNADAFAMFSLDEEGKAQEIKMKGISPTIDFSFDFQDLNFKRVETISNKD